MSSAYENFALWFSTQTHFDIRYTEALRDLLLGANLPCQSNWAK
jgi:hypothetical protein